MMWTGSDLETRTFVTAVTLSLLTLGSAFVPAPARAAEPEEAASSAEGVAALGRIEPYQGVILVGAPSIANAINGAVLRTLTVEAGDMVTKGQLLGELDAEAVEAAEVAVRTAQLELSEREAEMAAGQEQDVCSRSEVAQRTSKRRNNLLRSGVTSDEEADVAAGDAKALAGACASARIATKAAASAVKVAAAHLQRAQAEWERCHVRAPVDGLVLRTIRLPGEMLGADGVVELAQIDRMYAIAEVYETDIRRVHKGQKATVTSTALAAPLTGTVETIRLQVRKQDTTGTDPAARKDARVVEVEVLLDDPKPVATLTNLQVEVLLHP